VGSADVALTNAERLVRLEERLSLEWEAATQSLVISHDLLVTVVNWVYIWGHWPVILAAASILFVLRRDRYYLLRNAMFVSGLIGFAFFALFPVAPPRMLDLGLVDTVTEQSNAYRALQPPGLTNQYAAFPSLHAGWNVLVGIVLVLAFTSWVVRAVAVTLPCLMVFAVVATANHFVVDVIGGIALVALGFAVAILVGRPRTPSTLSGSGVADHRRRVGHQSQLVAVRGGAPRRELHRGAASSRAARRRAGRG
jgi:membrane-associated phospholipid phosphatase